MFQKILVSTDGSALAEEVASIAIELAQLGAGEIRAVCVMGPGVACASPMPEAGLYDSELYKKMRDEMKEDAQTAVDRMVALAREAGVPCEGVVRSGFAASEILAESQEWSADVIVMSTHGRRGILRTLLGSCATEVVHSASCPVLLHRKREESSS